MKALKVMPLRGNVNIQTLRETANFIGVDKMLRRDGQI
jgi:hypothetical protein